ncbi:hypothetical protein MIMGU_mgv1a006763mg [Erythranthe guttata]|uniref:BZIP domain-containing protein n=1 Tax=Erythranthe guttata TaxID=4155 RepID=A0A022RIA2_ERYGU|nr:PREDICTED: protein ABSCISIC ACID-INSENSITIVE 5-like [Erythranthe guttata]EYU38630.1 hypothetical protein MIMGU_mgv1a006763mg [Erythranthe guttata]|eukprot:XP_012835817.1 PREDICTED: protein ABSCISIC ACID-INSENSITIVE 5-like [Erythranthe guttata]
MAATDSEMMSQGDVIVNGGQQQGQQIQQKNQILETLGRQSSIYSLTLDEFQNTLCESGKNFGSMNMDEFLNSIWTAEENQAQGQSHPTAAGGSGGTTSVNATQFPQINNTLSKQPSLPRQGSLTIPEPLCRKTVDEVWSEIHNDQPNNSRARNPNTTAAAATATASAQKQHTFGEMTLEDFLVKAGVVREQNFAPAPPQQPQFGMYPVGPNFAARPLAPIGSGGGVGGGGGVNNNVASNYPIQGGVGEPPGGGYPGGGGGGMKRVGGGYSQQPPPPPLAVNYGGRLGNGNGGGFGGMGSPVSPASSDGFGANQMDSGYGLEMGGARSGRKRIIDGPVEKVVERRQRRMIKNRESAARSRARKQAYTVELEAELNQLKEENEHLQQSLAELERKRKQQYYEEEEARKKARGQSKSSRANEALQAMRRSLSCPY